MEPREKRAGKEYRPLERLLKAKEPHQVKFIWVKGHAGHPENEKCDALATSAADGGNLMTDQGLEA